MPKVYIEDGNNLTPKVAGKVAISPDGTRWDYIDKAGLKVGGTYLATTGLPYHHKTKTLISLSSSNAPEIVIEAQDVANQSTWTAGTQAALTVAVNTIASW